MERKDEGILGNIEWKFFVQNLKKNQPTEYSLFLSF